MTISLFILLIFQCRLSGKVEKAKFFVNSDHGQNSPLCPKQYPSKDTGAQVQSEHDCGCWVAIHCYGTDTQLKEICIDAIDL